MHLLAVKAIKFMVSTLSDTADLSETPCIVGWAENSKKNRFLKIYDTVVQKSCDLCS